MIPTITWTTEQEIRWEILTSRIRARMILRTVPETAIRMTAIEVPRTIARTMIRTTVRITAGITARITIAAAADRSAVLM